MRRPIWIPIVAMAALAVAVAGCPRRPPATQPASAVPASAPTVTVGYFPNVTHAPAVLGFSAGDRTFAKELSGVANMKRSAVGE